MHCIGCEQLQFFGISFYTVLFIRLFPVQSNINLGGSKKLVVLLSYGVAALKVPCRVWLPMAGVMCLLYHTFERGAFGLPVVWGPSMLSMLSQVDVIEELS